LEFNIPFQHKYGYIRDNVGSDVTIIEINIKIMIFKGKLNKIDITIFWSNCDSIPIPQCLERAAISTGHRMCFIPPWVRSLRVWRSLYLRGSNHTKCRGVYIFNSEYCGEKI